MHKNDLHFLQVACIYTELFNEDVLRMSLRLIKQHDIKDCGAACLSMICTHYKLFMPLAKYRELIGVDAAGANMYGIVKGAEKIGLFAEGLEGSPDEFVDGCKAGEFSLPVIARIIVDGMLEHYVVVYKITKNHIYTADPASGRKKYKYADFFSHWTGHIITFEKTEAFVEKKEDKATLRGFVKLVTRQKGILATVLVMSLAISFIGILGTFIFKIIIEGMENSGYTGGDGFMGYSLGKICAAIAILYLFGAVMQALRGYFLALLSKRIDLPLMLGYYNHVADLPSKHLDSRSTGEIMSRFNDASSIREAISGASLSLVLDTVMVVVCAAVLFSLDRTLFLVSLVTVAAYALVITLFVRPIKSINEKIMEQNASVTSYLKETVDGMETVKAFGAQRSVKEKTKEKFTKFENLSVKAACFYSAQDALSSLVASLGVVALLWCGTLLVINKSISLGTLITFYSLLGYFLDPIQRIIDLQPKLQTAFVAAERLDDILALETEKDAEPVLMGNDVRFENVDFRYGFRQLVLKDISLEIKSGEHVAFVGESGSGKTTLAKLIMAFYTPEKGSVYVGGQDLSKLCPKSVRSGIAYISQEVFLFSDTIMNNLTMGDESIPFSEIEKACRKSHADEFIQSLPLGYNTVLGENGHSLSGGQRQRLAIARALLKKPSVLIMDEATSNLDTVTEQSIKQTIESLEGITCIIIAHRLGTIKNCDRIFVMDNGEIVESGTHEQLVQNNGLYKKFCDRAT